MKTKLFYLIAGFVALSFASCENDTNPQSNQTSQMKTSVTDLTTVSELSPVFSTNLIAGKLNDAGDVNVYFDVANVYVEYKTSHDWYIQKAHLYVGDFELIPKNNNGNPIPGSFPVTASYPNGTQSVVYAIAKSSLPECFSISANAEVYRMVNGSSQTITAWGEGDKFTSRDWSMFFNVCEPN